MAKPLKLSIIGKPFIPDNVEPSTPFANDKNSEEYPALLAFANLSTTLYPLKIPPSHSFILLYASRTSKSPENVIKPPFSPKGNP